MTFSITPKDIDRLGPIPLYRQIADLYQNAIETGELAPGDALPSETEIERSVGVSRPVIRAAMGELLRAGYIVKRSGAATRVAERPKVRTVDTARYADTLRGPQPVEWQDAITVADDDDKPLQLVRNTWMSRAAERDGSAITRVAETAAVRMPTPEERRQLEQIAPGSVWDITRTFYADDQTVLVQQVIMPTATNVLRFETQLEGPVNLTRDQP